ncbi:MAG: carbohydrate kinase family protein [Methanosarcinales archaeon]|nr:MAG: carbohydrate kinase family protein [Methanosarcinales archaeon]
MLEIIGIGALNMDKLYLVERIAKPGEEVRVDEVSEQPGGSAANTIAGLAILGVKTGFIGRVGNDADGARLRMELEKNGVNTQGIEIAPGKTGIATVFVERSGERTMYVYPGANDELRITPENRSYAKSARWLHLSSFVGEDPFEMQKNILRGAEPKISFAPGMLYAQKGIDALQEIIAQAEIVFLNRDEIKMLTGLSYRDGAERLNEIGAAVVVVTLGKDGCYIHTYDTKTTVPGYAANVVDTTGAGDAFCAGFLCGCLNGKPLDECGRTGNRVAARCVEAVGARTGFSRATIAMS